MQARERVKRAIAFKNPDRLPLAHNVLPAALIKYGNSLTEILDHFPDDFGWQKCKALPENQWPAMYRLGTQVDCFGTQWLVKTKGLCGVVTKPALENWSAYHSFNWPQPSVKWVDVHFGWAFKQGPSNAFYARGGVVTFFELMQQLRGTQNLLLDLVEQPRELFKLREDLLNFNLQFLQRFAQFAFDGLWFADDWGTQQQLMIAPELWRAFFRPVYKILFEKTKAMGVEVHFHSDGNIWEIIPDLIDLGVDVLNCQETLLGPERLAQHFKGQLCFQTSFDTQGVLALGTPDEVRLHVLEVVKHLNNPQGGLIFSAEITPFIPLENIRALYNTWAEVNGLPRQN